MLRRLARSPAASLVRFSVIAAGLSLIWAIAAPAQPKGDVRALKGHTAPVACVAYSPNGKLIATGGFDKTLKLWDAATGREVRTYTGHTNLVLAVGFSPDGRQVLSGSLDGTAKLWDVPVTRPVRTLRAASLTVHALAVSPDGKTLVSGGTAAAQLWDATPAPPPPAAAGVKPRHPDDPIRPLAMGPAEAITTAAFLPPSGQQVIGGDAEGRLLLWNSADGKLLAGLEAHSGRVTDVAAASGAQVVSAGEDGLVKLWSLPFAARRALAGHLDMIRALALNPANNQAATADAAGAVRIWNFPAGTPARTIETKAGELTCLAYNPGGNLLAVGAAARSIGLWDPNSGQPAGAIEGLAARPRDLAFMPSGQGIITAGSDGAITLWTLPIVPVKLLAGHTEPVQTLALSPDGKTLASGGGDGTVRLWDPAGGTLRATLTPPPAPGAAPKPAAIASVCFSGDGKRLAAAAADKTVRFWDIAAAKVVRTLSTTAEVRSIALGHAGRHILIGTAEPTVSWIEVANDSQLRPALPGHTAATAPLRMLTGNAKGVTAVVVLNDGKQAASAGEDGTVRTWDLGTGAARQVLRGHTAAVLALAASPDGKGLISGGADRTARLWDLTDGKQRCRLDGHAGPVQGVGFSPDGKTLATVDATGTVRVWAPDGRAIESFSNPAASPAAGKPMPPHRSAVVFGPDNRGLFSSGTDPVVRLWTVVPARRIGRHDGPATRVLALTDGRVVSAGEDRTVRVWSPNGKELRRIPHPAAVLALALGKNATLLATGGDDDTVRLWNLADGAAIHAYTGHFGPIEDVAFSPDGSRLASASRDHTMRVWSTPVAASPGVPLQTFEHPEQVTGVRFGPDNKTLITSGTDKMVRIMEVGVVRVFAGHTGPVAGLALAAGGNQLVTAGQDRTVRQWDVNSGRSIRVLPLAAAAGGLAVSADGARLLTGTADGRLQLWTLADGKLIQAYAGPPGPVRAVAMSKTADLLASAAADGTVRAWSAPAPDPAMGGKTVPGRPIQTFHPVQPPSVLQVLADNHTIISGGDGRAIEFWAPAGTREVRTFTGHGGAVQAVAFSPDGGLVASGSADMTVKLWDPRTGGQVRSLDGHKGPVYALAFNKDGTTIASASADKTILLRNPKTGAMQKTLLGSDDAVYALAYRPDGTSVAGGGLDRTIRLWDPATGAVIRTMGSEPLPDDVYGLAFSPGGGRLVSTGYAGNLFVWDPETGKELFKYHFPFSASGVAYAPDGRHVAVACSDSLCYVIELPAGARD